MPDQPKRTDSYRTICQKGEATYTEMRSRFLAFALHVDSEEEAKNAVAEMRKKYYDARHVCFAYILGNDAAQFRMSDDGEPAGTAGAPLHRQLTAAGLTFSMVIVVRYFGGVKLGTSRLLTAYKTAAAQAIDAALTEERIVTTTFTLSVPYPDADTAMRFVRDAEATITQREYTATACLLTVAVRLDSEAALRERLTTIYTLQILPNEP